MEFWFILSAIVVFIMSFVVYTCLAIFFPEWVGITGRVALTTEQSHQEGSDAGKHWDGLN